jgi:hypothetical protein
VKERRDSLEKVGPGVRLGAGMGWCFCCEVRDRGGVVVCILASKALCEFEIREMGFKAGLGVDIFG